MLRPLAAAAQPGQDLELVETQALSADQFSVEPGDDLGIGVEERPPGTELDPIEPPAASLLPHTPV